ncbi:PfkB family carbohydrate kinase [Nocardia sp. NPDC051030]|uniref:PfkB family carbohydrate kinase n=1 Tax=Nocardia sp. NPDC051030 TaxID=3155162 RepID=UPI0034184DAC
MARQDADMVAVRSILTSLRKFSGLSVNRLRNTEIDTTTLLQLAVVRRFAHRAATTPEAALSSVIAYGATQLPPTHRLIVDAELNLGLWRDDPPEGIDVEQLYGPDLGQRRSYLVRHWQALHAELQAVDIPRVSTVRSLRDTPETQAFTALAELLTSVSEFDGVAALNQDAEQPDSAVQGSITIVGDAVMDEMYVVERFPVPGSSDWGDLRRHSGGKGLNLAVALARLGLDARLIAVIGADDDGSKILGYLEKRNVDTSLVRVVSDAHTPVTCVLMSLSGESATIAFKQDRLRLTHRDLGSAAIRQALSTADVAIVTFEQPVDIVAEVIAMVHALETRPRLIVNASPPVVLPWHVYRHLSAVDYLICTAGQLSGLWPGGTSDVVTRNLLDRGVGAVCTIDGPSCTVRSSSAEWTFAPSRQGISASAGAASAFSAALAYRMIVSGQRADEQDFQWATAAISARSPESNVPDRMPSVADIDTVFQPNSGR